MSTRERWCLISFMATLVLFCGLWIRTEAGSTLTHAAVPPADTPPRAMIRAEVELYLKQNLGEMVAGHVGRATRQLPAQIAINQSPRGDAARMQAAGSLIQTVCRQIELYSGDHPKNKPTLAQLQDGWKILLSRTDTSGKFITSNVASACGPYLVAAPRNPFNGSTQVAAPGHATPQDGWTFDESTGRLCKVVPEEFRHWYFADTRVEFVSGMTLGDGW